MALGSTIPIVVHVRDFKIVELVVWIGVRGQRRPQSIADTRPSADRIAQSVGKRRLLCHLRQALQHLLRLLLQLPELREQVLRGRGRLVAVEVFVRQDFVAELRAVFPADDGLGDFPFQERLDVLAVRDVFVVLHVVPVRPFDVFSLQ